MIRLTRPDIDFDELSSLRDVIESGWLTKGPKVEEFEDAVAGYTKARHAIAVSSGTAALHTALLASGIGTGDEVIVPDFTFPAPANMVEATGAKAVLADIDLATYNIAPDKIKEKITRRTKAIIPVHQFGNPAEMPAISKIAREFGLKVIEDAACALGAEYDGKKCGAFEDAGCFSFHPRKIITTGEGGMIITNDSKIAAASRRIREHGMDGANGRRIFETLGYNYRMPEISAVLGIAQMKKLDTLIKKRRALAGKLGGMLSGVKEAVIPAAPDSAVHIFQSYVILVSKKIDAQKLIERLRKRGVEAVRAAVAIHTQPYYKDKYHFEDGEIENSYEAHKRAVSLPLFPAMKESDLGFVADSLVSGLKESVKR